MTARSKQRSETVVNRRSTGVDRLASHPAMVMLTVSMVCGGAIAAFAFRKADSVTASPPAPVRSTAPPIKLGNTIVSTQAVASEAIPRGHNPAAPPPGPAPEGMVWIPDGSFWMGADNDSVPDAKPVHQVSISGFWMDRTEVTNEQFSRFVSATRYITVAERKPDPKDFPDAPADKLVPGSIVFTPPAGRVSFDNPLAWWRYVPGADWQHPEGPATSISGKEHYLVVQICWDDAMAYARWAGKRLPSEAEWEYAARAGKTRNRYVWGNVLKPDDKWSANIWQGSFPYKDIAQDGFTGSAPVGTFPPNAFGLVDMAGNVWEWCADWYRPGYETGSSIIDPIGPATSDDPQEPGVAKRVQRGGSFLCTEEYCTSYPPGTRGKGEPSSAASHLGFRCVRKPGR